VTLFAVIFVVAAVRDRLRAVAPALPLVIDAGLALIYTLATVLWVEGLEGADGSRPPYQAMP
jgi:hypothetical protein